MTLALTFQAQATLRVGDSINVRITEVDPQKGRMRLSAQPVVAEHWSTGVVTSLNRGGAVVGVTLEDGRYQLGFVPRSQVADHFVNQLTDVLAVGQEVRVRVVSFNPVTDKMTLSMIGSSEGVQREEVGQADLSDFRWVPANRWMIGQVAFQTDAGFFVTLESEAGSRADGFLKHQDIARL